MFFQATIPAEKLKFETYFYPCKPYWNNHLTELWKELKTKEKLYTKESKLSRNGHTLLTQFRQSRKQFDRFLRKYEREYYNAKAINIDKLNAENPREFWKALRNLGPRNVNKIQMKVHDGDDFNTNLDFVLDKWKQEFETLYNPTKEVNFDDNFLEEILTMKHNYEENPTETNDLVNEEISYDEIEKLVKKAKSNKALVIDFIPNEVLKFKSVILALWKLFTIFFKTGLTPSIWLKPIVNFFFRLQTEQTAYDIASNFQTIY